MFSHAFIASKLIIVCASLVALLWDPRTVPYVFAANIASTIPEAWRFGSYTNAAVGCALMAVSFWIRWNETRPHIVLSYIAAYCVWNAWFNYMGHSDWYAVIPPLVVPAILLLWFLFAGTANEAARALWLFTLARIILLIVLCFHVASPISCHRR